MKNKAGSVKLLLGAVVVGLSAQAFVWAEGLSKTPSSGDTVCHGNSQSGPFTLIFGQNGPDALYAAVNAKGHKKVYDIETDGGGDVSYNYRGAGIAFTLYDQAPRPYAYRLSGYTDELGRFQGVCK